MSAATELKTLTEALAAALGRRLTEHDGQLVSAAAALEVARRIAELTAVLRAELNGIFEAVAPLQPALREVSAATQDVADSVARAAEAFEAHQI